MGTELTERQEQALRGLRLCELALEEKAAAKKFRIRDERRWWAPGAAARQIADELPHFHQHGNGAMGPHSWSGRVPVGRIIAPAVRALVREGLAEARPRWDWPEDQRSGTYRLTTSGRKRADALLAAQ